MTAYIGANREFQTELTNPKPRRTAEEKACRRMIGSDLYRQLEAVCADRWVNHLPGKSRVSPLVEERQWEERLQGITGDAA